MESQGEHEAYTYPPWYLACRAVNFYGLQVPSKSIANFTHISSCEYHITEEPYHLRPFLCYIWALLPSFQSVTTLMCDWWVAEMSMKDGWRSAREEVGGQCVMMIGMTLMQWWCADSLEYLQTVSHVPVMSLLFSHDVYLHVYIRKRFVYYYLACRFTSSRTGQQIWPWNWTHLLG